MNEVNKTLFIPLYGKSKVSKEKIILDDPMAEKIWAEEGFELSGKSKSNGLPTTWRCGHGFLMTGLIRC